MHALKWYLGSAFCFSPDGAEGASAAGGDSGGSSVAAPSTGPADGGGGSESPGASPSPPETTPAGSDKGADPWANLGSVDDLDYVEIPAQLAPEEPKTPEPPVQPQEPPPVQPPAPPTQPTPQQPPTAAPGEARPLSAADPWRIAEGLEANRADVIAHLAGTKFALSEDDIKDLDTDVTVAVPKLLSRVFLESQMAMQKFLAQAVPGMIQNYNTVTGANNEAEKKFFDSHKALDIRNPQHRAAAVRIATIYRQANPGIPLDQLIQEVGPMVMASLQMNGKMAAAPASKPPKAVAAFRPAVAGGGGAPIANEPANEWAGLGQQYD